MASDKMPKLKPFFTYYGGKYRAAPKYPKPLHGSIVEPFAGSAGYAMRYPDRHVILVDADPVVAGVWDFLIRSGRQDILQLPLLELGQSTDDLSVCQEARWLIGFWLTKGGAMPNKTLSAWGREPKYTRQFWGPVIRDRVASQVQRIKHWRVVCGDFEDAPDIEATWFVDPPYQTMGKYYTKSKVDYERLAGWCRTRKGQTIVCENEGATWLPFEPFMVAKSNESKTGGKRSREAIWMGEV